MKKLLAVLSALMLVIGIVTLAAGAMNIGLLSSIENGGPMAGALIALTVILLVAGGLLDVLGGLLGLRAACWACGRRSIPPSPPAPSSSACWP